MQFAINIIMLFKIFIPFSRYNKNVLILIHNWTPKCHAKWKHRKKIISLAKKRPNIFHFSKSHWITYGQFLLTVLIITLMLDNDWCFITHWYLMDHIGSKVRQARLNMSFNTIKIIMIKVPSLHHYFQYFVLGSFLHRLSPTEFEGTLLLSHAKQEKKKRQKISPQETSFLFCQEN